LHRAGCFDVKHLMRCVVLLAPESARRGVRPRVVVEPLHEMNMCPQSRSPTRIENAFKANKHTSSITPAKARAAMGF